MWWESIWQLTPSVFPRWISFWMVYGFGLLLKKNMMSLSHGYSGLQCTRQRVMPSMVFSVWETWWVQVCHKYLSNSSRLDTRWVPFQQWIRKIVFFSQLTLSPILGLRLQQIRRGGAKQWDRRCLSLWTTMRSRGSRLSQLFSWSHAGCVLPG